MSDSGYLECFISSHLRLKYESFVHALKVFCIFVGNVLKFGNNVHRVSGAMGSQIHVNTNRKPIP
jgi:hypothetical protein